MSLKLKYNQSLGVKLEQFANPEKAMIISRFFKTAPGDYGAGDSFLGITVPLIRALVKEYRLASNASVIELLDSPYHEVRLLGILIIVDRYEHSSDDKERLKHLNFYLKHRYAINNWDLVDLSVYKVWGDYLLRYKTARTELFKYAQSKNLWDRRLAVVATMSLIKAGQFKEILELVRILKNDQEDLIQKALGWMLREVGKQDELVLKQFLDREATSLARTTLRYAIERLVETERQYYLKLRVID